METQTTFNLVTGEKAYAIWYVYNDCDIDMERMLTLEKDLELIMGSCGEVYAYRSNLPMIMARMFMRSGAWEHTEDTDYLSEKDLFRLEVICRNFSFN